ncbi:MAG TPA: LapA family protein [Acidimicrobiia bacterium]|nr:LapA family protein [Acidimicrobiia bacterium]
MTDRPDDTLGADLPPVPPPEDGVAESSVPPSQPVVEKTPTGTGPRWGLIIGIILAIPLIVFLAQNTQYVVINFMSWTTEVPLVSVLASTVVLTVIITEVIGLFVRRRRRKVLAERAELRRLRSSSS